MFKNNTFILLLAIHVLLYLSVGFDIPIIRQCVGFIYLTFVSGFVIVGALRFGENSVVETIMLSVGLSIAFAMFAGLVLNTLGALIGFSAPLSTVPSTIFLSSLTLAILLLNQLHGINKDLTAFKPSFDIELDRKSIIFSTLLILDVLMSIIGAIFSNVYLIIFTMLITAFASIVSISSKILPSKYHPILLFCVSLSLLFQTSLLSSQVMGYDIFSEYYVFKVTNLAGYWNPPGVTTAFTGLAVYNSVLSVTILPTVYSSILNVSGDLIFKLIYPSLFAFVPLFLYKTYEGQLGKTVAILSVFLFIANPINFYGLESLSLGREMIAYLFFAGAVFSLLNRNMAERQKRILFIIFSAALAVSAYSLSFIYAFFLVLLYITLQITGGKKNKTLSLTLLICVISLIFAWYMFVSTPPVNKLNFVINNFINDFTQDLFNTRARLDPQFALLSPTAQTTFVGMLHKLLIYLTQGLIVVGAVVLAFQKKIIKISEEFRWIAICAVCILIIGLVVPNVATAINFSRFYRITMIFLSPLFVIGGIFLLSLLKSPFTHSSVRAKELSFKGGGVLLLAIILSAFFIFSTGLANYVSGDYPISYSLSYNDMKNSSDFAQRIEILSVSIPDRDVWGAKWLAAQIENDSIVYADELGSVTLFDYTVLSRNNIDLLLNTTRTVTGAYIYLRTMNVMDGILFFNQGYPTYDISDISNMLVQSDKVYSNGQCDTYYIPG